MDKRVLFNPPTEGSAEEVLALAAWDLSRGRLPSQAFVGEEDPIKALRLAAAINLGANRAAQKDAAVAARLAGRGYDELNDDKIAAVARHIIRTSSSEEGLRQDLRARLGCDVIVHLRTSLPANAEVRELVGGLGGPVMANGAMAIVIIKGHNDFIDL